MGLLFVIIEHLEEEFNRKIVCDFFGASFNIHTFKAVMATIQIEEMIMDEVCEMLRIAGIDSLSKLLNKMLGVTRKGQTLMINHFQVFYEQVMRKWAADMDRDDFILSHYGQHERGETIHEEDNSMRVSSFNLIKEIDELLRHKATIDSRTASTASM